MAQRRQGQTLVSRVNHAGRIGPSPTWGPSPTSHRPSVPLWTTEVRGLCCTPATDGPCPSLPFGHPPDVQVSGDPLTFGTDHSRSHPCCLVRLGKAPVGQLWEPWGIHAIRSRRRPWLSAFLTQALCRGLRLRVSNSPVCGETSQGTDLTSRELSVGSLLDGPLAQPTGCVYQLSPAV